MLTNNNIIERLRESEDYKEFFRNALADFGEKFGSEDIASWSEDQKAEFFNHIEAEWSAEDPATDDGDEVEEECGEDHEEDKIRQVIRREIANALRSEGVDLKHYSYESLSKKKDGKIDWKQMKDEIWNDYASSRLPDNKKDPDKANAIINALKKKFKGK